MAPTRSNDELTNASLFLRRETILSDSMRSSDERILAAPEPSDPVVCTHSSRIAPLFPIDSLPGAAKL
jgi:hypothetical protein